MTIAPGQSKSIAKQPDGQDAHALSVSGMVYFSSEILPEPFYSQAHDSRFVMKTQPVNRITVLQAKRQFVTAIIEFGDQVVNLVCSGEYMALLKE